jgi:hypothetical protein
MNLTTSSIPASWIAIFVRRSKDPLIGLLKVFPISEAMLIAQDIVLKMSPMKDNPLFDRVHIVLSFSWRVGARTIIEPISFTNVSMSSTIIVCFVGSEVLRFQSSNASAKFIHWSEAIVTLEDIPNPVGSMMTVIVPDSVITIGVVIAPPEMSWRVVLCSEITVVITTTVGAWNVLGIGVVNVWLPTVYVTTGKNGVRVLIELSETGNVHGKEIVPLSQDDAEFV